MEKGATVTLIAKFVGRRKSVSRYMVSSRGFSRSYYWIIDHKLIALTLGTQRRTALHASNVNVLNAAPKCRFSSPALPFHF